LAVGSPRNQQTNIPGLYAIGECDYQFHGANRLGANSLVACLFSGLTVAPGIAHDLAGQPAAKPRPRSAWCPAGLLERAVARHQAACQALQSRPPGGPNPYRLHAQLGRVMTRSATVIRHNADLEEAYGQVCDLEQQWRRASLADGGNWCNQNLAFTRALGDMFPLAKAILKGALARDECRGAHYKPEFTMPEITVADPAERRRQAAAWCARFEESNRRWLCSTIAACGPDGQPQLSYEEVDTSLLPPRPRLYGLAGSDAIEQAWKEREAAGAHVPPKRD
jgi:succinate dehydrogenase / fumarate reductase flavoprotein subunit